MTQCNAVGGINLWPRVISWLDVFWLIHTYSQTPKEIESARRARMIVIKKGPFMKTVIGGMTVLEEA